MCLNFQRSDSSSWTTCTDEIETPYALKTGFQLCFPRAELDLSEDVPRERKSALPILESEL